ncbi:hypothetical protein [Desulfotalea psychrophila]|nr:hypothetical protein [Desulfotalea psychrophila]
MTERSLLGKGNALLQAGQADRPAKFSTMNLVPQHSCLTIDSFCN